MLKPALFDIDSITEKLRQQNKITVAGLYGSSCTLLIAELAQVRSPLVFIAAHGRIEKYWRELTKLIPETILINEENLFYLPSKIIITKKDILDQAIQIKEKVELFKNGNIDMDELVNRLHATGYSREDIVEEEREYALRGGILDVFEPHSAPVRIEFYGDTIFSIREFNTQTQRSVEKIEKTTLILAKKEDSQTLKQLIDKDTIIVSEEDIDLVFPTVVLSQAGDIQYHFTPPRKYFGDFKSLREDIAKKEYTFKFFIPNTLFEKLTSLLGEIEAYQIPIEEGFVDEAKRITYLTETEIFGEIKRKKRVYEV